MSPGALAIMLALGSLGCAGGFNVDDPVADGPGDVVAVDGGTGGDEGTDDKAVPAEPVPEGDPCTMGEVGGCACPGTSEQGMRVCVFDAMSPEDGFFGECTACPPPEEPGVDACADGMKNGFESDTDCGGPGCDPCADGDSCVEDSDCMSGTCTDSACDMGAAPNPCADPSADTCSFDYTPSNFDPDALDPGAADASTVIDCDAVLSTDGTPSFTTWCSGTEPPIVVQTQDGGGEVAVVTAVELTISGSLRVTGSRPAVLAVFGDATVQGNVDASADGRTPVAGGNQGCDGMGRGEDSPSTSGNTGGGGGGGFGTAGGAGGTGDDGDEPAGAGGAEHGTAELQPLRAGCAGGTTVECNEAGGAGGGAIQISAAGALSVAGSIAANGGDGENRDCGAGGGSGGGILLEGFDVDVSSATLSANGGDGSDASAGGENGASGSTSPSAPGGTGAEGNSADGGSGGGGGYGRIAVNAQGGTCTGAPCP